MQKRNSAVSLSTQPSFCPSPSKHKQTPGADRKMDQRFGRRFALGDSTGSTVMDEIAGSIVRSKLPGLHGAIS